MTQTWNVPTAVGTPESQAWQNIHDAAEALCTLHAGPAEPPATAAYMLWMDTTNAILKQRNNANTDWIPLFTIGAGGIGVRQSLEGWYQDDVVASQTAVVLTRAAAGALPTAWIAPRAGSIIGVAVLSTEARTAGTLTVEVFKNGSGTGLTAVLDGTNTTLKVTQQAAGLDTFAAGDQLDLRITTDAGWLPVTADIRGAIEVET